MLSVTDLSKALLGHCSRGDKMENSSLLLFCVERVSYLLAGGKTRKEIADREANVDLTCLESRGKIHSPQHQWQR